MNVDLMPGGSLEPGPLTATRGDKLYFGRELIQAYFCAEKS